MITYVGHREFTLQKTSETRAADDAGRYSETWRGAADLAAAFAAGYAPGSPYGSGYIAEVRREEPQGPYADVEIVVVRPPDFGRFTTANSTTVKTATKSAQNIACTGVLPDYTDASGNTVEVENVNAEKKVTYLTAETKYTYHASSKPSGPRFSAIGLAMTISVLSRSISVTDADGGSSETVILRGATAPAPIASALTMPEIDRVIHEHSPIPGTPWYRCTDTVTREYLGDE